MIAQRRKTMTYDLLADLKNKYAKLSKAPGENQEFLKNFIQLDEGDTVVRILPSVDENKPFFAENKIHRVPSGNGQTKNVHCRKIHGEACPLCDLYYEAWNVHNTLNLPKGTSSKFSEFARGIKPTPRSYLNIYKRETDEVLILSTGDQLLQKIISAEIGLQSEDSGSLVDVGDSGIDFKIVKVMVKSATGIYPNYNSSEARRKAIPLADSKQKVSEILARRHDIQALIKLEPFEEVKKVADQLYAGLVNKMTHTEENISNSSPNKPSYLEDVTDGE